MIKAENISKSFKIYEKPSDRLKEIVSGLDYHSKVHALRNISFNIEDGETVGIIGQNGAGKSTLLKILNGVILPDCGSFINSGRTTGLLELGTGFNIEYSGIENIYLNGMLLGMSKPEIENKLVTIKDFSDLGDFINKPLRTYSTGMTMRLAFSIAVHADPKCFLVDEVLTVGDAYFQHKCIEKLREFRRNGGSIIFVSHDMNAIKMLCDKAILLNNGEVVEYGNPDHVVNKYSFLTAQMIDRGNKMLVEDRENISYGTFEAKISSVSIRGEMSESDIIFSGEYAVIKVIVESQVDLSDLAVGFMLKDRFGQEIFGTNTFHHGYDISLAKKEKLAIVFKVQMNLGVGKYFITSAIHSKPTHGSKHLHWAEKVVSFEVAGNKGNYYEGVCKLYPDISFDKGSD